MNTAGRRLLYSNCASSVGQKTATKSTRARHLRRRSHRKATGPRRVWGFSMRLYRHIRAIAIAAAAVAIKVVKRVRALSLFPGPGPLSRSPACSESNVGRGDAGRSNVAVAGAPPAPACRAASRSARPLLPRRKPSSRRPWPPPQPPPPSSSPPFLNPLTENGVLVV